MQKDEEEKREEREGILELETDLQYITPLCSVNKLSSEAAKLSHSWLIAVAVS